jgi:SP family xylose:H+ symportor-like MFS transporter
MMNQTKPFNNVYIIGISFISALGGYLFGFDFAVISGALPFLRKEFALDPLWEGFLTGSLALGCIAGCLKIRPQARANGSRFYFRGIIIRYSFI